MAHSTSGTTLYSLLAAACWGSGDFAGSVAVKRSGSTVQSSLLVVVVGHLASLVVLAALALLLHSAPPTLHSALWAIGGGIISGASLIGFYFALADGHMGSAAAIGGLLSAAVPAAVAQVTDGVAHGPQFAGFAVAAVAIWLVASVSDKAGASRRSSALAALAGLGFGVYFVALRQAGHAGVLWPTACARVGSAGICVLLLAMLVARHQLSKRSAGSLLRLDRHALQWILGGATLDLLGNLCFVQATRVGRLDVAAVITSIYPAGTILLAAAVLHERTTVRQRWGMVLALPAIVLITL